MCTVWTIPLSLGLGYQANALEVEPLYLTLKEEGGGKGGGERGRGRGGEEERGGGGRRRREGSERKECEVSGIGCKEETGGKGTK